MVKSLKNGLNKLRQIPGAVLFYAILGIAIIVVILKVLGKITTANAKELNIVAMINSAIRQTKIKFNQDKINELKKDPETVKDPKDVEKFYKDKLK